MKLNKTLEYSIRALGYLSKINNGEFVTAKEIAKQENLPVAYLPKILKNLAKAGILTSIRGEGYALTKPLHEITVKELSDAIDNNRSCPSEHSAIQSDDNHSHAGRGKEFLSGDGIIYNGLKERIDKLLSEIKLSEIINNENL